MILSCKSESLLYGKILFGFTCQLMMSFPFSILQAFVEFAFHSYFLNQNRTVRFLGTFCVFKDEQKWLECDENSKCLIQDGEPILLFSNISFSNSIIEYFRIWFDLKYLVFINSWISYYRCRVWSLKVQNMDPRWLTRKLMFNKYKEWFFGRGEL